MQPIRRNSQSGFTLMELLIVISVLGLLLGMLIPRLGGVTDDTVDTVCDTNNKGVRYFTQMYYNKNGTLPNGWTNLVDTTNTADAIANAGGTDFVQTGLPSFEDPDTTGAEDLAAEFYSRNWPGAYALNQDEVDELAEMGITTVYDYVGATTGNPSMDRKTLAATNTVMMMGVRGSAAAPAWTFGAADAVGNPHWIGRIMMAVNEQTDVVREGMLQASALCPGAVLAEDNFEIKEYVIVLPRLQATTDALTDDTDGIVASTTITFEQDLPAGSTDTPRVFQFDFEAMAGWNFDFSCPEGHKWPDFDEDAWNHDSGLTIS